MEFVENIKVNHPAVYKILRYSVSFILVFGSFLIITPLIAFFSIVVLVAAALGVGVNAATYSVSLSNSLVKQLVTGIIIVLAVVWLAFSFLDIYTHHGQEIAVPNFKGLTVSEVEKLADSKNLRFEVLDSVYRNDKTKGTIVEQIPPPNFNVKQNRTIFVTINAFGSEMVRVPNLIGNTLVQAQADLEISGLSIGRLEYVPDIAKNVVKGQKYKGKQIADGEQIPKGSRIDLVLGRGIEAGAETPVPDLIGLTKNSAVQQATSSYFNLGAVIYDTGISNRADSLKAMIWKQNPAPNQNASPGSLIDIYLTNDQTKIPKDTIE